MKSIRAAPSASSLIESMRDLGYSLETALADVIDNSITAGASVVDIRVDSGSHPRIAVIDNGCGMQWEQLIEAMRPGSRSPLEARAPADLGRFGLGLKTASFSQCRRLTVVTRQNGETHAAIWDLQHVAAADDWELQVPSDTANIPWMDCLPETGTLVLWEDLDRLIENQDSHRSLQHFIDRVDDARSHLELVFHRFLSGEPGHRKTVIRLNDRPLEGRDPFHQGHPATVIGPLETIKMGTHAVRIQAFTLPHHRKTTPEQWDRLAGREGYLKNQGFYVYRERRLIIYGTWFGLAKQSELTKLARVRVDIPNGLDAEWKIDVKKASAQPPLPVRERLRRIIESIGATSKRVYTARGQRRAADDPLPIWIRLQDKNQICYRINRDHPLFSTLTSQLPSSVQSELARLIEMLESTLPLEMIFSDIGSTPARIVENSVSDETLRHAIQVTAAKLREVGVEPSEVLKMLRCAEPFRSNWARAAGLIADLDIGTPPHAD